MRDMNEADFIAELKAERDMYKAMLERCGMDPATGEPVVHGVTATQAETDEYNAMLKKHKENLKPDTEESERRIDQQQEAYDAERKDTEKTDEEKDGCHKH